MLTGFPRVMSGMAVMSVSYVRMVRRRFVIACFMLLRRGMMMLGRVFVMFGCFSMVIDRFFRHGISSLERWVNLGGLEEPRLDSNR
jgi:hypothetical protein